MNLSAITEEEKLFLRRIQDLFAKDRGNAVFSSFLTPRQAEIAGEYVRQRRYEERCLFYGGFLAAQRRMLGVFPDYRPPEAQAFPIQPITILYRQGDALSHRDFLGACLGLLIKRDSLGDIIPDDGRCTIFARDSVCGVILQELRKVGSIGVRCQPGAVGEVVSRQEYDSLRGTVSSTRLDCLVSLATGLSREKSARLIQSERVQLDYVTVENLSKEFSQGNTVAIRGYGKFIVDTIGSPTRKGRLPVELRKYV